MPPITPAGATLPGVTHHLEDLNGTPLHYVSAGTTGAPILLVHGWPETWWAFRKLIPLLAGTHRVIAPDLRGFGDSGNADTEYGAAVTAEDLHQLVEHLGAGPVHLLSQDISGGVAFRLAALHPEDVLSFTGVETTLPGFGFEALADVTGNGSWHVGFLAAPGIPDLLLPGQERKLLTWAFTLMNGTPGALTDGDIDEFVRTYARPDGWRGTAGLYQSALSDRGATKTLAGSHPLAAPVLAVGGASHPFTADTFRHVTAGDVTAVHVEGAGHLVAQEAPEALAAAILEFTGRIATD